MRGIAFFPNNLQGYAVVSSAGLGLCIVQVTAVPTMSLIYTYANSGWNLYQTAISPSGSKSLSAEANSNLVIYMSATTSSLTLIQAYTDTVDVAPVAVVYVTEYIALITTRNTVQKFTLTDTSVFYSA